MARTALAVQVVTRAGLNAAYTAANVDGHSIQNDGRMLLHVKNGATDETVTLKIPRTIDGKAVTNPTVVVTASQDRFIGPFPVEIYNQGGADGDVIHIDFAEVTNTTIAALRV